MQHELLMIQQSNLYNMKDLYELKEDFKKIYFENIKRDGAEKLFDYLENSDFFTAPSSSRFHSNFEGGLVLHSINVYNRLLALIKMDYGEEYERVFSNETIAIVSLLHDLCKIDYYEVSYRNTKNEFGEWVKVPYYTINDKMPYGHGEKSVYIVNGFIRLTREEAMAINWHMGGFDLRVKGGSYSQGEAYNQFPLCVYLQVADMMASYLDEGEASNLK